ncbi:MAG: hypothetical protein SGCHY_004570 [Lobulomycetales sp.]
MPQSETDAAMARGAIILDRLRNQLRSPAGTTKKALRAQATADLIALAARTHNVCGKWMIFAKQAEADKLWAAVAQAVFEGSLDCSAKISTLDPGNPTTTTTHVICVYVANFQDIPAMTRVLEHLCTVLGRRPSAFKADFWTTLGIYGNNEWGIPPTLYTPPSFCKRAQIPMFIVKPDCDYLGKEAPQTTHHFLIEEQTAHHQLSTEDAAAPKVGDKRPLDSQDNEHDPLDSQDNEHDDFILVTDDRAVKNTPEEDDEAAFQKAVKQSLVDQACRDARVRQQEQLDMEKALRASRQ